MSLNNTITKSIVLSSWIENNHCKAPKRNTSLLAWKKFAPLTPVRLRLDAIAIKSPAFARRICRLIPAQCPFAREIRIFDRTIANIPPLCKLNPLYENLIALRFRALCYLADECGEDISAYC